MNAQQKAEAVCHEIYKEAQDFFAGIHRHPDYGFKILNAPPVYQTPFLFIGYQPGGVLRISSMKPASDRTSRGRLSLNIRRPLGPLLCTCAICFTRQSILSDAWD